MQVFLCSLVKKSHERVSIVTPNTNLTRMAYYHLHKRCAVVKPSSSNYHKRDMFSYNFRRNDTHVPFQIFLFPKATRLDCDPRKLTRFHIYFDNFNATNPRLKKLEEMCQFTSSIITGWNLVVLRKETLWEFVVLAQVTLLPLSFLDILAKPNYMYLSGLS